MQCCRLLGNCPSVPTAPLQKPRSPHSRWKRFLFCFSLAGKFRRRLASGIVAKQLGNCKRHLIKPFHISRSFFQKGWESWILTLHMTKCRASKLNTLWNSLRTRTHLPLCDLCNMPNMLCPNLRFPSSVIATSFGLSRCLLPVRNPNLQSESLAQEQNCESGGPGHRQLKASWPWLGNK